MALSFAPPPPRVRRSTSWVYTQCPAAPIRCTALWPPTHRQAPPSNGAWARQAPHWPATRPLLVAAGTPSPPALLWVARWRLPPVALASPLVPCWVGGATPPQTSWAPPPARTPPSLHQPQPSPCHRSCPRKGTCLAGTPRGWTTRAAATCQGRTRCPTSQSPYMVSVPQKGQRFGRDRPTCSVVTLCHLQQMATQISR